MKTKKIIIAFFALGTYFTSNAQQEWQQPQATITPALSLTRTGNIQIKPASGSGYQTTLLTTGLSGSSENIGNQSNNYSLGSNGLALSIANPAVSINSSINTSGILTLTNQNNYSPFQLTKAILNSMGLLSLTSISSTSNAISIGYFGGTGTPFTVTAAGNLTTIGSLTALKATLTGLNTKGIVTNTAAGLLGTQKGNGFLKDDGTGTISYAIAGTDYQAPIILTTTGTSGVATFNSTTNVLNIPNYTNSIGLNSFSAMSPLLYNNTTGAFSLGYNTTNLQISSNKLNTIQDISTTSSPTFLGANITDKAYIGGATISNSTSGSIPNGTSSLTVPSISYRNIAFETFYSLDPALLRIGTNNASQGIIKSSDVQSGLFSVRNKAVDKVFTIYNIEDNSNTETTLNITANGNLSTRGFVKIGENNLSTPDGYNLYVQKGILTEKIVVALHPSAQWPDFVFAKSYKLKSLKEVESYINANKHLPDVPSANEMKSSGLDVVKSNAILLQKIEELTLYIIDLQKQVEALKK